MKTFCPDAFFSELCFSKKKKKEASKEHQAGGINLVNLLKEHRQDRQCSEVVYEYELIRLGSVLFMVKRFLSTKRSNILFNRLTNRDGTIYE
jgi:hypothetical protein